MIFQIYSAKCQQLDIIQMYSFIFELAYNKNMHRQIPHINHFHCDLCKICAMFIIFHMEILSSHTMQTLYYKESNTKFIFSHCNLNGATVPFWNIIILLTHGTEKISMVNIKLYEYLLRTYIIQFKKKEKKNFSFRIRKVFHNALRCRKP